MKLRHTPKQIVDSVQCIIGPMKIKKCHFNLQEITRFHLLWNGYAFFQRFSKIPRFPFSPFDKCRFHLQYTSIKNLPHPLAANLCFYFTTHTFSQVTLSLWILDSEYHSHYRIHDGTIENVTEEDVLSKRGFCLTISLSRMSIYILEHNHIHYKAAPKKFHFNMCDSTP